MQFHNTSAQGKSCYVKHNKYKLNRLLIYKIILLISLFPLISEANSVKHLTFEDGLSNRRVFSSASDNKGFIWFATKTNIDRYDGEKFDYYTLSNNEKNKGVIADQVKNIYAFTERTVYFYDELVDDFREIFSLNNRKDLFLSAAITSIYFDQSNRLYITTNLGALISNGNEMIAEPTVNNISTYSVIHTSKSLFFIGTSAGLYQYHQNGIQLVPVVNKYLNDFKSMRIQSLYFDAESGKLWIGTFAKGLYVYDINHPQVPQCVYKMTMPVKTIAAINENEIWAGSDGEGIFVFNKYDYELREQISQNENAGEFIGANGIYHIMRTGNYVWVSTYTGGVFLINTKSIVDKIYKHEKFNKNSLADNHVNVIYEDSDGNLWFGTNKGLSFLNVKSKQWKHYMSSDSGDYRENSVILSLQEDNNGDIWVGGYATKLSKINKTTGKITDINTKTNDKDIDKSYIYSIVQDESENIWFGGSVDKLMKYDVSNHKFYTYDVVGVNKILDFDSEILILGTYNGLFLLNKKSGKIQLINFKNLIGGEKLISSPFINNIIINRFNNNTLLVSTEGFGLIQYNMKTSELKILNTQTGLSSNYIYGLIYDKRERLWITTEYGLDCYDEKSNSIMSYFKFDGLSDNTFNFLSYAKLRTGELLLGTPEGVNVLNPDEITRKTEPDFNLHFKGFYLFYEKAKAQSNDSPLKEAIDQTKEIRLTYNQHTFSIDFINMNLGNQRRTLYSWKLEGFNDEWTQPSTEHKAVYTNIPSGNYRFMVKAMNIDNNQQSEIRTIEIKKLPPFWASIYAYIIYFILISWLVYFLIRYWLNKVDSKFTQDKIRFFVSMAHEIRTPITLIKAPLNEIDNENLTKEGRSALELARRNTDKLFGMVSQLLDFQKIEADAMCLCIEETHLNVFLENIINNFIYLARNKEINLIRNIKTESNTVVWFDRSKVQIMIENLLTNAIKYTEKNGEINVFVEKNDNKLIIKIKDNGIGIPENAQSKLFSTFYRAKNAASSVEIGTGIGLMFTKKLVELHKGEIQFISSENIGTTFKIELPVDKSDYHDDVIVEKKEQYPENDDSASEEDDTKNQMHIMLVEDNDEIRIYLAKMLRKKYTVVEAANGIEALTLLENESPDLILSDILMPEMNGFELCEKIKTGISTCHIPFIILTSLSDREDVVKGLSLGADDYITKPFDILILESKIKAIFNNRALFRKKYIEKSVTLNESNILNDLNKTFMKKLVDQIESNITNEEFNIDELAYEMAMSRSVFFKKVKSLTGQNPKDFIRDIKMNKAADLLRDKKYSISEIAYLIGFPNAKYFSTAFKKYYGITPTTFIEQEKRQENYLEHETDSELIN